MSKRKEWTEVVEIRGPDRAKLRTLEATMHDGYVADLAKRSNGKTVIPFHDDHCTLSPDENKLTVKRSRFYYEHCEHCESIENRCSELETEYYRRYVEKDNQRLCAIVCAIISGIIVLGILAGTLTL